MISRFFAGVEVNLFTEISAGIFFVLFIVLIISVYAPGRKIDLENESRMPLKD